MTKDEYVKKLQKCYDDNKLKKVDSYGDYREGYTDGLVDSLVYAIDLAEKLDEPKKVVIPEFIANDIDRRKKKGSTLRIFLEDIFDWRTKSDVYYWFFADGGDKNFMKYISAWDNGYEVEKEKKYLVKIKGIGLEEEWLNCEVVGDIRHFELNSSTESKIYKTNFTKQWLKDNWPEYEAYNNAGLLEFEEVEDEQASTEKGTTR